MAVTGIQRIDSTPVRITLKLSSLIINAFADSSGGRVGTTKSGRKPSQRSRSAIVVVGQDELERYFVFKAWAKHCTTDELIDEIFLTDDTWHPRVFGVDATGTQTLFIDALHRMCREKGRRDRYQDLIFEGDKDFRIETNLQPLQAAGRLFVCDTGMMDLKLEYESFPGSNFKDILDAIVGCLKLFPRQPKPGEVRREMEQYTEHLQRVVTDPMERVRRAAAAFEQAQAKRREVRAG